MKKVNLSRILYMIWVATIILFVVAVITYVPSSEASDLYPVTLTEEQARQVNSCIYVSFKETNGLENQLYRYGMLVGAVGDCVFSVAYPNGTMEQYYQFLDDWKGFNFVEVPFPYVERDYKF